MRSSEWYLFICLFIAGYNAPTWCIPFHLFMYNRQLANKLKDWVPSILSKENSTAWKAVEAIKPTWKCCEHSIKKLKSTKNAKVNAGTPWISFTYMSMTLLMILLMQPDQPISKRLELVSWAASSFHQSDSDGVYMIINMMLVSCIFSSRPTLVQLWYRRELLAHSCLDSEGEIDTALICSSCQCLVKSYPTLNPPASQQGSTGTELHTVHTMWLCPCDLR